MPDSFAHLHVHSEYSMLDGAARIPDVIARAKADGQPAVGITDHGNMYGVLDFYKAARDNDIKPIIGMEGYFVPWPRTERRTREEEQNRYHLLLLAETTRGYKNLIQINSRAYLDGYFYKPRIDWELLEEHHEGLIATSGCLGGLVCQELLRDDPKGALEAAGRMQEIFGRENFFVELQDHGIEDQQRVNPGLVELAAKIDAPLVATNDLHYVDRDDFDAHDALLCVQTGSVRSDEKRFKFQGDQFFLKSAAEMRALFADHPEACDNTLLIAERANVEIEFGNPVLPNFPVPEGHDEDSYLRHLTYEGARERYGASLPSEVTDRLDYELSVIAEMGFSSYFLIVWDLIRYAKERDIRVGPGRGSAAGCCVAYCLRITEIDPIRYDLLFERFLNPGRREMPDIDMDFDERHRSEMIRYAADRYGEDHVAQIVTFSTIKARAAVRDAARVLDYPYGMGDKVAKAMPPLIMGRDTPLWACLEKDEKFEDGYKMAAELREMYDSDPDVKRVIDVAKGLEGMRRQDGIHAAAVVITKEPLTEYLPVQRKPEAGGELEDAPVVTQYEMHGVEELGLLKMDFLGLRNLSVIERALELIEKTTGERPDIDAIPLDDEKTFDMLRAGDSIGVFQLEGGPMRSLMRSLAPTTFEDICALVALYRPGPMESNMHTDYADRKNGRQAVSYYHDDVEDVLAPTYGLMIYQEQLMRVAQKLAGYSLEEADNLRKATGKKKRKLIAEHRERFVEGCDRNGYGAAFGEKMFDIIEPFADYSFNKSHSFGYGYVAYQTAWLKANYAVEYLAALLTSVKGDKDKTAIYLNECRNHDIDVVVPDVNRSESDFAVVEEVDVSNGSAGSRRKIITFGLSAVRNVGEGLVGLIVEERDANGPFTDFYDFCERVDPTVLNKRAIESLIKAGAFDSLDHPRKGLLLVFEQIVDQTLQRRRERDAGVMNLFDDGGSEDAAVDGYDERVVIPDDTFEKMQRLAYEKEMLGLYVSDHPLMGARRSLARLTDSTLTELREAHDGEIRTVGGVVTSLKRRYTKKGDLMATFVLEDLESATEVMVFPRTMQEYGPLLDEDAIVCVKARLDLKDDVPKLIAVELTRPEIVRDDAVRPVELQIPAGWVTQSNIEELTDLLSRHPGDCPVVAHLRADGNTTKLRFGDEYRVDPSNGLLGEVRVLLGAEAVV